jgi:hypothetical protein
MGDGNAVLPASFMDETRHAAAHSSLHLADERSNKHQEPSIVRIETWGM